MSTSDKLKDFGGVVAGFGIIAVLSILGVALLYGAAEFSVWALEWAPSIFGVAFAICLLVFLPLSAIGSTRGFAGNGFYLASYLFGLVLWVLAMAFVYIEWGLFAVIIGLVLGGIGVVPIAILAAILEAQWTVLGNIAVLIALTIGLRIFGYWLIEKAAERAIMLANEKARAQQATPARRLD
ncbi:hypothetical protein FGU71_07425 [Erythrobacter insulae]|uniref:Uncharacterized protein n=1 Tax=Erythrobacter insulae TaxID=2584124 RepID=A0A547PC42_9SPHN|nr:hypothetical protein [Erythrobacter insulae]TRD11710.1 hypothetical protein FGU71_07425 [Erythrobacter insulae]